MATDATLEAQAPLVYDTLVLEKRSSNVGGRGREIRSSATRRQPGQEPFATRLSPGFNDKNRMLFPREGSVFFA
jgi:hypothetical protein